MADWRDHMLRGEHIQAVHDERVLAKRMRDAIGFCKSELEIKEIADVKLSYEEKVNFEKCLTQNFLMKEGMDYFGKRDLIFIDLLGSPDVRSMTTMNYEAAADI